jgi:mono/diheme cytochrome c family protein
LHDPASQPANKEGHVNDENGGRGRVEVPVIPILFALFATWPYSAIDRSATPIQLGTAQYPEGVTEEKVAAGQTLFAGEVGCHVCHGRRALGILNWTSNLTDGIWLKIPEGRYEAILAVIRNGVEPEETGGVTMPPMGRKDLTAEQVEALAAYLWSVNHDATDQP